MFFFTSDQHLDHEKIIKHCKRPFADVDQMNEAIIGNWNKVVKKNDTVYCLGDFTLGRNAYKFIDRLVGNIVFVAPEFHHDARWLENRPLRPNIRYLPPIHVEQMGNVLVHMCHYPILVWDRKHYGSWNLYGHVHNKEFQLPGFSYNVGVDVNDFTPVSFKHIKSVMESQGWTPDWKEFS